MSDLSPQDEHVKSLIQSLLFSLHRCATITSPENFNRACVGSSANKAHGKELQRFNRLRLRQSLVTHSVLGNHQNQTSDGGDGFYLSLARHFHETKGTMIQVETNIFVALDYGLTSGPRKGRTNAAALQRAVDEARRAGGGTVQMPDGVYEIQGAIKVVPTSRQRPPFLRIVGGDNTTLIQRGDGDVFEVLEGDEDDRSAQVVFERLHLQGRLEAPVAEPEPSGGEKGGPPCP
jgi:hypothetical protein